MWVKIGVALLVIVVLAVGFVAMQPAAYEVTRTAQISAPPAEIHAMINDFHRWDEWSPWAKLDPDMKTTYSGASQGTGAVYHWDSKKDDVGEGRMTIIESVPPELVLIRLEFIKPFEDTSLTKFTIIPTGDGSTVTWSVNGEHGFVSKAVMLTMGGMDKAVGGDFEKGLAQMKAAAEKK